MAVRVTTSFPLGRGMFDREHIVDQESDLSSINTEILVMGSGVYVIETGNTYVLNSKKEWKVM